MAVFLKIYLFQLEDNLLTTLWWQGPPHQQKSAMGTHAPRHPDPPPTSLSTHPSGLSWSTCFGCPASCIRLSLVICFTYGNVHISVLFSQVIPPLPSEVQGQISSAHKEGEETAYRFDSFSPSLSAHPFH